MAKKRVRNKKGQIMGMPFQFIFSLILIAVAFFAAFWAIRHFMNVAEAGNIGDFVKNQVEATIKSAWQGGEAEMTPSFDFSTKFGAVCFANVTATGKSKCASGSYTDNIYFNCEDWAAYEPDKNFFLIGKNGETGIAEKYGLSSAWLIEQVNITKNPVCYPVEKGKVAMNFTKGKEYGCAPPLVCVWQIAAE